MFGVLTILATTASADPINKNTKTFTADCAGLGIVEAVAVGPGANAFHVVDRTTVLIQSAPGVTKLATAKGTTCSLRSADGQPASGELYFLTRNGSEGSGDKWNAATDWKDAPDQANPSPDSAGNPGVWQYLASDSFEHDPDTYQLLGSYDSSWEMWKDTSNVNLFVGHGAPGSSSILMPSAGGRTVSWGRKSIVAWTSPITGRVRASGSVALPSSTSCATGSGIKWSVHRGTDTLSTTTISGGGSASFDVSVDVEQGAVLYFAHDPGEDSNCDLAMVQIQISR
jgi:hypothetical protein